MRANLSIRSHLFIVILCAALPVLGFAAYVSWLLVAEDRESIRRGAMERTRAILTAVDADMRGSITTVEGLATSHTLETGDLRAFHAEAVRVLKSQPDWLNITLALPSGEQVANALVPFGGPLPAVADAASADMVLKTGRAAVGSVATGNITKIRAAPVRVPVTHDGKITYVLSAVVRPESLEALLRRQNLPQGWVIGLVDADGRFVARVPPREVGSMSSDSFRAAVRGASEGWFRGTTVEGTETFTAFYRSDYSNWSIGFAIPVEFIEAGARRTTRLLALGALVSILLAFIIAAGFGRRIADPLVSLAARARAIGQGGAVDLAQAGRVTEVGVVAEALKEAGEAVQEQRRLVERERDALVSADRAKDEFIAMLSHEMRNPLAALNAAAQVLKIADPAAEPAAHARGVIERQTGQMTRLIEDLLDINRVVMGKATLIRAPMDLGDMTTEVVRSWRESRRFANHRVELRAAPAPVDADRSRMEQVLSNLLDNALKFSPAGTTIRVEALREGSDAVLRVTDEGEGMEPAAIERMFQLFVQGSQGLERRTGGLGVGLALVRKLVLLHGGTVTASSEGPGRGASFTVRIPAS